MNRAQIPVKEYESPNTACAWASTTRRHRTWHEPNGAGHTWDFLADETKKDFDQYLRDKAEPQVRELLTGYGPVALICFDTPRVAPCRRVLYFIIQIALLSPVDASWRRQVQPLEGDLMKSSLTNLVMALGLVAIGVAIGAAGIYIGDTDDAPGAALMGILLMIGAVALGVRTARRGSAKI